MKEKTKKKFAVLATIFVIGTVASVAVNKLAGENAFLRQLVIVIPAALAGFAISSKERDSLFPNSLKAWIGFIIAALFISLLFWALEHYSFNQ